MSRASPLRRLAGRRSACWLWSGAGSSKRSLRAWPARPIPHSFVGQASPSARRMSWPLGSAGRRSSARSELWVARRPEACSDASSPQRCSASAGRIRGYGSGQRRRRVPLASSARHPRSWSSSRPESRRGSHSTPRSPAPRARRATSWRWSSTGRARRLRSAVRAARSSATSASAPARRRWPPSAWRFG